MFGSYEWDEISSMMNTMGFTDKVEEASLKAVMGLDSSLDLPTLDDNKKDLKVNFR